MSTNGTRFEIECLVKKYVDSIDKADTDLASSYWLKTEDVSYIHPGGHERGWEQVRANFYEKGMRDSFLKRQLKVHDLVPHLFESTVFIEFYLDFEAIQGKVLTWL